MAKNNASAILIAAVSVIMFFSWIVKSVGLFVVVFIGILTFLIVFGIKQSEKSAKEKKLRKMLSEYPSDEFGPVFQSHVGMKEFNTMLSKKAPVMAMKLRTLQIIRESLQIAVTTKNKKTAESRIELAIKKYEELCAGCKMTKAEIELIDRGIDRYMAEYATAKYINEAQGYIDKIAKVKTEKTKKKYAGLAKDVLEKGLNDSKAEPQPLLSKLKEVPTF